MLLCLQFSSGQTAQTEISDNLANTWQNQVNETRMLQIVKFMSSDEFGGRRTGTDGDRLSQSLLDTALDNFGLKKLTNRTDYRQIVPSFADGESANILGSLRSSNLYDSINETIILSANADHIGMISPTQIYNGANDNASGVSVTLEVAMILSEVSKIYPFKKNIIFAFWAAEERGRLGSQHFLKTGLLSEQNLSLELVINLDQVGYDRGDGILKVSGGLDVPELYASGLTAAANEIGISRPNLYSTGRNSDHQTFLDNNTPAYTLIWESNGPNYHTVNDTWEKIDPNLLGITAELILELLINQYDLVDTTIFLSAAIETSNSSSSSAGRIVSRLGVTITLSLMVYRMFFLRHRREQ